MSVPFLELDILDQQPESYARSPIPNDYDEAMSRFTRAFVLQPEDTRHEIVELLTYERTTLRAFAARAASLALAEESADRLKDALVAAVIENFESDEGMSLVTLTVLYHTAHHIEVDFNALSRKVLESVPGAEKARAYIEAFLQKPRTLEDVSLVQIEHEDGFRFKSVYGTE